jgi:protein-disulfide isomerase
MSQRPPKKNRSSKRSSRRPRSQSTASTRGAAQDTRQQAPQSARTANKEASASGPRSSERRQARREAAIRQEQKKKQMRLIIGGVAAAVVVAVVLILLNRPTNTASDIDYAGIAFAQPPITETQGTPQADGEGDSSFVGATLGDPDAPVTFAVYADFQCSFCVQFHNETYPQIIEDFVRDGEVKIEFREFPALGNVGLTDDNNESVQPAEAAMCAGEQDSYLEYHDKLYANFSGVNQGAFANNRLKTYARDLGLDTDAFNECLDNGRYEAAVIQSLEEGRANGITATPMFIIDNGSGEPNIVQQTSAGYDLLKRQIEVAVETAP